MKSQQFHITGMHCEACASTIHQGLKALSGVKEVDITFSGKTANVDYDEQVVQPQTLLKRIQDLGYNATLGETAAAR